MVGAAYMYISRHLKEELASAIEKQLQIINNAMHVVIYNSYATKELKNNTVLS